jgi:biopolymer transport protein ExbD
MSFQSLIYGGPPAFGPSHPDKGTRRQGDKGTKTDSHDDLTDVLHCPLVPLSGQREIEIMSSTPKRFLDVWIIDSNTVYREVPFTVVADWIQQGRLLEDDMLRPSGTAEWMKVGASPSFAPYLPKVVPHGVEDRAEALEPVDLDFAWKKSHDDEDDDCDMIPLIDVSLVLLIFFMMTTTVVIASSSILVPETENGATLAGQGVVWIGIDKAGDGTEYSIGEGDRPAPDQDRNIKTLKEVLQKLDSRLKGIEEPVEIRVSAHRDLPYETVRKLTEELEPRRRQGKIREIRSEVNEKKP